MTGGAWAALAAALVLVPGPIAGAERIGRLADGRRLGALPVPGRPVPRAVWRPVAAVAAVLAAVVLAWAAGPALAIAGGAAAGCAGLLVRDLRAGRAAARRRGQLLTAVRVVAGELEAGSRPAAALTAAADVAPVHAEVLRAAAGCAAAGGDAGAVLAYGPAGTRALGVAWQVADGAGIALAGIAERVAGDLAAAEDQRRALQVALSGPRSSAALLCGLPALGLALGAAMGAHPLGFLLHSPPGRAVCCAGVLLDVAGVLWVRQILRRAEQL